LDLSCFPDTQDNIPNIPVHLTRVGVTGVKKLLKIEREGKRPIVLLPTFDAFVDLPALKGEFTCPEIRRLLVLY
jgi:GTP cyclohydrolase-4